MVFHLVLFSVLSLSFLAYCWLIRVELDPESNKALIVLILGCFPSFVRTRAKTMGVKSSTVFEEFLFLMFLPTSEDLRKRF